MAIMSRLRNLRHSHFARVRHQRRLLAFLAAQDTRLTSSASGQTVDTTDVAAAAAAATLTFGANAGNTKVVLIGVKTYTFVTALTEAKATGTFTNDGSQPVDGSTVVIGSNTYTFQDTLTNVAGHVKIAASNTASMTNLFHAINASGGTVGTDYATLCVAHPTVVATNPSGTTVVLTAKTVGIAGNSIATTVGGTIHGSFAAVTLLGGVAAIANEIKIGVAATNSLDNLIAAVNADSGEGSLYATGTTENATVDAAAGAGDTMTATAHTAGAAGNSIPVSTDVGSATWDHTALQGGSDATFGPTLTASSHGYTDGEGPYVLTSTLTTPGGYTAGTLVWIHKVDANTIALALSRADALTANYIPLTSAGTGVLTLTKAMTSAGIFEMLRTNRAESLVAASDVDSLS